MPGTPEAEVRKMSDAVLTRPRTIQVPRLAGYGAAAGLAGGVGMALWQMIDSAATSNGFWTPLNLCMASFVWRGQAAMIEKDMMMHPGMSMNMPVAAGHLAVGMILHLAFSVVVGIVFITILFGLRRAGLGVLRTAPAYVAASVAGAARPSPARAAGRRSGPPVAGGEQESGPCPRALRHRRQLLRWPAWSCR